MAALFLCAPITRYKGRAKTKLIERDFPHRVEMIVRAQRVRCGKEPNQTSVRTRYDSMAELSADQKRTDLLFGSVVLGVLLFVAVGGVLLWMILPS